MEVDITPVLARLGMVYGLVGLDEADFTVASHNKALHGLAHNLLTCGLVRRDLLPGLPLLTLASALAFGTLASCLGILASSLGTLCRSTCSLRTLCRSTCKTRLDLLDRLLDRDHRRWLGCCTWPDVHRAEAAGTVGVGEEAHTCVEFGDVLLDVFLSHVELALAILWMVDRLVWRDPTECALPLREHACEALRDHLHPWPRLRLSAGGLAPLSLPLATLALQAAAHLARTREALGACGA
mmetsp:Transcript_16819/g.35673  ORF Transcript_16819/g.35673 Transcript_16819/m.35673 type:complete len:240 (+) Transcript_16819:438-1157(+)